MQVDSPPPPNTHPHPQPSPPRPPAHRVEASRRKLYSDVGERDVPGGLRGLMQLHELVERAIPSSGKVRHPSGPLLHRHNVHAQGVPCDDGWSGLGRCSLLAGAGTTLQCGRASTREPALFKTMAMYASHVM